MTETSASPPSPPSPDNPVVAPEQPPASQGGNLAIWFVLGVIAFVLITISAWAAIRQEFRIGYKPHTPLPVIAQVPEFELMERSGRPVNNETLDGRIWVADFIFTRCAGTCPKMSSSMKTIQNSILRMPTVWPGPALVSFTVDPEWDTEEVLAEYADRYKADGRGWLFLRGTYEEIQKIAVKGFLLGLQQGTELDFEPIVHSQSRKSVV